MNELIKVELHNESLEFIKGDFSECWVVVKRICENIGLASNKQIIKIKNDKRFSWYLKVSTGTDGKKYQMFCLAYEDFWGWLFSINPKRVKPETAKKLNKYYKVMKQSIHDIVMSKFTLTPGQQTYQIMEQRDRYLMYYEEEKQQVKKLLPKTPKGTISEINNKPRDIFHSAYWQSPPTKKEDKKKFTDINNNLILDAEVIPA